MAQPSLFAKLWDRKVFQLLGTYLAVGFGVLQFLEFIARRYDLEGSYVDFYLLLWLGLLPAVALLLYYQGLPPRGTGKVASWKRWAVYANVLLLLPLLFLLPGGEGAAQTQVVETTNDAGEMVQRIIPAASAVQRVAIFELNNEEADPEKDWWGTAYGLLIAYGLEQRPEIQALNPSNMSYYYGQVGAEEYEHINVATQREIAQRVRKDYFLSASYKVEDGRHEITGTLHQTKDGKSVATLQAVAPDPYQAADIIKDQIFDYLPEPVVEDGNQMDLPASSLISDNVAALEAYTKGVIAFDRNPSDLNTALDLHKRSLAEDPSCAPCAYAVADKLYGLGKKDSSLVLIKQSVRLASVLPERFQYKYKQVMFSIQGNYVANVKLMESWRRLYPFEFSPYASLSSYYKSTIGVDTAITLMQQAAELSDREQALINLVNLYQSSNNFSMAEETLKDLENEYPDTEEIDRRYVSLYRASGAIDKARNKLADMIALDPLNGDLTNDLVKLEQVTGNYATAERLARNALKQAPTYSDSTTLWNGAIQAMGSQGRVTEAMAELDRYEEHISRTAARVRIVLGNLGSRMNFLIVANRFAELETVFAQAESYDPNYVSMYRCYLPIYTLMNYQTRPEDVSVFTACEAQFKQIGEGMLETVGVYQAILDEDFKRAASLLEEQIELGRKVVPLHIQASVFRQSGDLDRALELIAEEETKSPSEPLLQLEKALTLQAKGDVEGAKSALKGPLETYASADPDFVHLQRAQALAESLELPVN